MQHKILGTCKIAKPVELTAPLSTKDHGADGPRTMVTNVASPMLAISHVSNRAVIQNPLPLEDGPATGEPRQKIHHTFKNVNALLKIVCELLK